jgi:hypothetical protein
MKRAVSTLLLCVIALNGCFSYGAVPPAQVPPQMAEVRVHLSRPMDVPVTNVTVRDVVQVTGEMIGADSASLRLSAFGLRSATGYGVAAAGETVRIPRDAVAGLQRKRMDPARSALLAGVLAAASLGLAALTGTLELGRGDGPTPPNPR